MGVTNRVEKRGLTVVNVTHNNNDGCTVDEVFFAVLGFVEETVLKCYDNFLFNLDAEFVSDEECGIVVDGFVDRNHHSHAHKLLNNLCGGGLHTRRKLGYADSVGNGYLKLNGLGLLCLLLLLLLSALIESLFALLLICKLVLFLDFLHARGRFGHDVVIAQDLVVVLRKVDVRGAARIDNAHFIAGALLLGLLVVARLRLLLALFFFSGGASGFRSLAFLFLLGVLFIVEFLEECGDVYLILLGESFENDRKLGLVKNRHVSSSCEACIVENGDKVLAFDIKILSKGVDSVFLTRCCHMLHTSFLVGSIFARQAFFVSLDEVCVGKGYCSGVAVTDRSAELLCGYIDLFGVDRIIFGFVKKRFLGIVGNVGCDKHKLCLITANRLEHVVCADDNSSCSCRKPDNPQCSFFHGYHSLIKGFQELNGDSNKFRRESCI